MGCVSLQRVLLTEMRGLRCAGVSRLAAICAVNVFLLVSVCNVLPRARGWSGFDAHTIVLLNSFDTDATLQEQFYNAPSGTSFSIAREGYRVVEAPLRLSRQQRQRGTGSNTTSRLYRDGDEVVDGLAYPLNPVMSTAAAYQSTQAVDAALPFHGRFSDDWVVWTKADMAQWPMAAATTRIEREPVLLHCRLPLPQNRTEVQRLQRRYVAAHHAAFSAALEQWFHTTPSEHASHCLYGDGERTLTGAERYYELCPRGLVSRVQHHRLATLLRGSGEAAPEVDKRHAGKPKKGGVAPLVMDFLHEMHRSPSNRNAILRNPRYHGVFQEIGRYHPRYSKPRWNSEYLAWESWYPSTRPCATHYTTILSRKTRAAANATQPQHKIHPSDAYWKTVVRFRCPSEAQEDKSSRLSIWSVVEVRQLCEYQVELLSDLVCGWEQELDSFNVNPIPCVVLD